MIQHVDTSHFRAPYKNGVIQGFGAEAASIAAAVTVADDRGVLFYKPDVKAKILAWMSTRRIVLNPNDNTVTTVMAGDGDPRETVNAWMARKLLEGKAIAFSSSAGITGAVSDEGATVYLTAVECGAGEAIAKPSAPGLEPVAAILLPCAAAGAATASMGPATASMGPATLAIGALVVGAIAYLLFKGKKK